MRRGRRPVAVACTLARAALLLAGGLQVAWTLPGTLRELDVLRPAALSEVLRRPLDERLRGELSRASWDLVLLARETPAEARIVLWYARPPLVQRHTGLRTLIFPRALRLACARPPPPGTYCALRHDEGPAGWMEHARLVATRGEVELWYVPEGP